VKPCEVAVVGAGIVGAATAWELHARGVDVALLDRGEVSGATTGLGEGNVLCSDKEAGPELGLPYLPLDARGPLLVRLHRSDGGCFAADFAAADIRKNEAAILRATPPDRPGRLVARAP